MSKFVVSARKYRPRKFEDVIGQNHIAKTLQNALQHDQLAHAFLFTGPRGVGKTTCARILAKVINCMNPIDKVEPCNTCSSCKSFNENASFNIFELDAASNNSVEHIRTLIEQVRIQPQQGTHKVFIIDEVHMLSTAAFNAFLKTLEEPPPYAIFILATTEKHKILPTILSRCQIFDFKRIQPNDIVVQLEKICTEEARKSEPEALYQIALKADGGMRDALSIFDKISGASGDIITYKDVIANLNILDYEYYFKMTDTFLRSDHPSAFLLLDEVIKNGFDIESFIEGLMGHLRELLIAKDPQTVNMMETTDTLKKRYYEQATLASESFLLSGLNILNIADLTLPRANNKRLHLEIALAKLNHLNQISETSIFEGDANKKKTPNAISDAGNDSHSAALEKTFSEANPTTTSITNQEKSTSPEVPAPAPKSVEIPEVINTPSLLSAAAIRARLKEQEKDKNATKKELTFDEVNAVWQEYRNNVSSMSTKTALGHTHFIVDRHIIKVYTPSTYIKERVMQESDLIAQLRTSFFREDLVLDITVDKTKFPDYEDQTVVKTKLTTRETYDAMVKKNPALEDFIKELQLKTSDSHR
jgi:DNA polymerase III subunit gamma/tau